MTPRNFNGQKMENPARPHEVGAAVGAVVGAIGDTGTGTGTGTGGVLGTGTGPVGILGAAIGKLGAVKGRVTGASVGATVDFGGTGTTPIRARIPGISLLGGGT